MKTMPILIFLGLFLSSQYVLAKDIVSCSAFCQIKDTTAKTSSGAYDYNYFVFSILATSDDEALSKATKHCADQKGNLSTRIGNYFYKTDDDHTSSAMMMFSTHRTHVMSGGLSALSEEERDISKQIDKENFLKSCDRISL